MAGYFPSSLKSDFPDFSTSEVKTGQKWIDGKDIYCIVFNNTMPEILSTQNVAFDSGIIGANVICKIGDFKNIYDYSVTLALSITYNAINGQMAILNVTTSYSEKDYYIIMYYTKP